jgi:hypothetical protein
MLRGESRLSARAGNASSNRAPRRNDSCSRCQAFDQLQAFAQSPAQSVLLLRGLTGN